MTVKTRALAPGDLDAVVAIDAALTGRTRRAYFERRLAAALRQPTLHLQYAAEIDGALAGHALARVLEGEFGLTRPALRLEVISVARTAQGSGIGRALHGALEQAARKRSIGELRTAAPWRDHAMLRFLAGAGYALSGALVLDCALRGSPLLARPESFSSPQRAGPVDPNDWSAPSANDFEQLARDVTDVRLLSAKDFEDVARIDGVMAGYVMARADLGDFGRTEPVAVIDTLGVAPEYAHRGIGHALLQQLFLNLDALRIERVETVVAARELELLGFFYGAGFAPAQRLAFIKPTGN